jgi:hypothetical protein
MKLRENNHRARLPVSAIILISVIIGALSAMAGIKRDVLLHVESAPSGWIESRLPERLAVTLGRSADMAITMTEDVDDRMPPFPKASRDFDSLTAWGTRAGGRYLIVVRVASQRFETRKTFNMPLVFQKYEVFAVLEGELRIIDLQKPKLLAAEPFVTELKGPRVFQASMEDDKHDPDLHLTAVEKVKFLGQLEQKVADQLVAQAKSLMRGK